MRLMGMLFFISCTIGDKSNTETTTVNTNYCNNNAECGEGLLCVDNSCLEAQCITSMDCQIEEFCSEYYQCVPGCMQDTDCFSGEICQENACVTQGCRDTELDCEVGEFCDQSTATCYEDSFDHCASCDVDMWQNGISGGHCVLYNYDQNKYCDWNDFTLSGTGCDAHETCLPLYLFDAPDALFPTQGGFCSSIYSFKTCATSGDVCPRGFSCRYNIYNNTDPLEENVDVCLGDCDYYRDNGFLD